MIGTLVKSQTLFCPVKLFMKSVFVNIKTIFRPELFGADIASVAQPIHMCLNMEPDVATHTRRGLSTLKAGPYSINFLL